MPVIPLIVDRRLDPRLVSGLGYAASVMLVPFIIYHMSSNNAVMTAICIAVAVLMGVGATALVIRPRNRLLVQAVASLVLLSCNLTVLLAFRQQGGPVTYWAFPVLLANFYIFRLWFAISLSAGLSLILTYSAYGAMDPAYFYRMIINLPLTMFFAIIFAVAVRNQQQRLERLAGIDPVTGAGNRRTLETALTKAMDRYQRYGESTSLVMFDLDHFKKLNDDHGHLVGDEILVNLVELVQRRIRNPDEVYRYGGEEFVVLLQHTDSTSATEFAESLRLLFVETQLSPGIDATISLGVSSIEGFDDIDAWLKCADDLLYQAKEEGRNRVCSRRDPDECVETT